MASATNRSNITLQFFMPPLGEYNGQGFNDKLYASALGSRHHGGRGMTVAAMVGWCVFVSVCVLFYAETSASIAKNRVQVLVI
jgi:hypothetical protein